MCEGEYFEVSGGGDSVIQARLRCFWQIASGFSGGRFCGRQRQAGRSGAIQAETCFWRISGPKGGVSGGRGGKSGAEMKGFLAQRCF